MVVTVAIVSVEATVVFATSFTHVNPLHRPVVSVCTGSLKIRVNCAERERNYARQPNQLRPGTVLLNRDRPEERPHGQIWTSSRHLCLSLRETGMNPNQLADK